MDSPHREHEQTVSLGHVAAALRRQGRIVGAAALLGTVVAGGAALAAPPSYTATALVALTALPADPLSTATTTRAVNTATESEIVQSSAVAEEVAKALGGTEPGGSLINRVTVSTPQDSAVLRISFTDSRPAAAAAGANAFAQSYLAYRSDLAQSRITTAAGALDTRLNDLVTQRSAATAASLTASSPSARAAAAARAQNLSALIGDLSQQRARLNNPTLGSAGDLVGRAETPTASTARGPAVTLVAGTGVGLVLGMLLAVLWDRRGHRVRDRHQVQAHSGAPVLASVPLDDDPSAAPARAEAYRRLAVIAAATAQRAHGGRLVLAGAGAPDDGEAAGRLAAAISAHVGPAIPTTLLCPVTSLDAGRVAARLQAAGLPAGGAAPAIRAFADDHLPGPATHGSSGGTADGTGVFVVDAVSTTRHSTALAVLTPGTPVLVVVRLGQTRVEELERVTADVRAAGAVVAGVVVQYPPRRRWSLARRRQQPTGALPVRPTPPARLVAMAQD